MTTQEKNTIDMEQQRHFATDRGLRLQVVRSNWGRDLGWFVELQGQRVALLTDPQWADMFWVSYLITPLTDDPGVRALLEKPEFWWSEDVRFRSRGIDFVAPFAFGAGAGPSSGRIAMRGLYFVPRLTWFDRVILFYERLFPKHRGA